jgi:hypothetical protein
MISGRASNAASADEPAKLLISLSRRRASGQRNVRHGSGAMQRVMSAK